MEPISALLPERISSITLGNAVLPDDGELLFRLPGGGRRGRRGRWNRWQLRPGSAHRGRGMSRASRLASPNSGGQRHPRGEALPGRSCHRFQRPRQSSTPPPGRPRKSSSPSSGQDCIPEVIWREMRFRQECARSAPSPTRWKATDRASDSRSALHSCAAMPCPDL